MIVSLPLLPPGIEVESNPLQLDLELSSGMWLLFYQADEKDAARMYTLLFQNIRCGLKD